MNTKPHQPLYVDFYAVLRTFSKFLRSFYLFTIKPISGWKETFYRKRIYAFSYRNAVAKQ